MFRKNLKYEKLFEKKTCHLNLWQLGVTLILAFSFPNFDFPPPLASNSASTTGRTFKSRTCIDRACLTTRIDRSNVVHQIEARPFPWFTIATSKPGLPRP